MLRTATAGQSDNVLHFTIQHLMIEYRQIDTQNMIEYASFSSGAYFQQGPAENRFKNTPQLKNNSQLASFHNFYFLCCTINFNKKPFASQKVTIITLFFYSNILVSIAWVAAALMGKYGNWDELVISGPCDVCTILCFFKS